jgi:hypothetical protein
MFGIFKETEEDKAKRLAKLESEVARLNHSHSMYINRLLYVPGGRYDDDWFAWFLGFYVNGDKVVAAFRDSETPLETHSIWKWDMFVVANGEDVIERWHNRYLNIKKQFSLLGVELVLKKDKE